MENIKQVVWIDVIQGSAECYIILANEFDIVHVRW